jgi:anti-sigma factor RsiW
MEHQPFETWIIDEIELNIEQKAAMDSHLAACPKCRGLSQAWSHVRERIETAPVALPAPGFSQRFQSSLAERQLRKQQLQVRRLFLFLVLGAALSFFTWIAILLASASPVDLLVAGFQTITQLFVSYDILQHGIVSLFFSVPIVIPIALWILITSALAILALIWAVSLWRIAFQGVYPK